MVFREEEFVGKVLDLLPIVGTAGEYSEASAFPRAVVDEFVIKLWIGVDIRLGSPVLYILSVAGCRVVPLISLTSAFVMGAVDGKEDLDRGLEYKIDLSVALYFVVGASVVSDTKILLYVVANSFGSKSVASTAVLPVDERLS